MFRYRKLTTGAQLDSLSSTLDSPSLAAGAVYDVEAIEAEADQETLLHMLERGKLGPSDLVFSSGRWTTFSEAPEFYEQCIGLDDERVDDLRLRAIGSGLLSIAFLFGTAVLRFVLRR